MAKPFLSVIIPVFNEQTRIVATLDRMIAFLKVQAYTWEVLVVDDGSTDDTVLLIKERLKSNNYVNLITGEHKGKGWAVRQGMLRARGLYRFMCDADLAMPIEGLQLFLNEMSLGQDIVIGSRQISGARRLDEPKSRHILGRLFNFVVKFLAVRHFEDTQCGFKCFRGELVNDLFTRQKTVGFGFDVEILYLAVKRGFKVKEIPVDWYYQTDSKVRPVRDAALMVRDIILVRWRDLRGSYDTLTSNMAYKKRSCANNSENESSGKNWESNVVVVLPTYNEAENLKPLVENILSLGMPNCHIIVVDDNSPDGTAAIARDLSNLTGGAVELINRPCKDGLGTAYIEGFALAFDRHPDFIVQMDADLSHNPEYIPKFLEDLEFADVVVGSRYVEGGQIDRNWGVARRVLSFLANIIIRNVSGIKIRDASSGYKAYRVNVLKALDLSLFKCKGFGFQIEVIHALENRGYTIWEHPINFIDRTCGNSKMTVRILIEAFCRLLLLRWRPI